MLRRQRGRSTSASAESVANAATTAQSTHTSRSSPSQATGGSTEDATIATADQTQRVLVGEDLVGGQVHFLGRHVQRLAHLPCSSPHELGVAVFTQSLSGEYLKFEIHYANF